MNQTSTEPRYHIDDTELQALNTGYIRQHGLTEGDIEKVNQYVEAIEKQCSQFNPGCCIEVHGFNTYRNKPVIYENAHLESIKTYSHGEPKQANICVEPYVPFAHLLDAPIDPVTMMSIGNKPKRESDSINVFFSTSGGYWFGETNFTLFESAGTKKKTFCIWGHRGPWADGAINFLAEVNVYKYTNLEKIY